MYPTLVVVEVARRSITRGPIPLEWVLRVELLEPPDLTRPRKGNTTRGTEREVVLEAIL